MAQDGSRVVRDWRNLTEDASKARARLRESGVAYAHDINFAVNLIREKSIQVREWKADFKPSASRDAIKPVTTL